jgi:hypothetical protein
MNTKQCSKCKQIKPLMAFTRDRSRKAGYRSQCKECYRKYATSERGKAARHRANQRYYQTRGGKASKKRGIYGYWERHPDRLAIAVQTRAAVRRGELLPIHSCTCAACGSSAQEYHHPDYSKPLEVVPLCKDCHTLQHHPHLVKSAV